MPGSDGNGVLCRLMDLKKYFLVPYVATWLIYLAILLR